MKVVRIDMDVENNVTACALLYLSVWWVDIAFLFFNTCYQPDTPEHSIIGWERIIKSDKKLLIDWIIEPLIIVRRSVAWWRMSVLCYKESVVAYIVGRNFIPNMYLIRSIYLDELA